MTLTDESLEFPVSPSLRGYSRQSIVALLQYCYTRSSPFSLRHSCRHFWHRWMYPAGWLLQGRHLPAWVVLPGPQSWRSPYPGCPATRPSAGWACSCYSLSEAASWRLHYRLIEIIQTKVPLHAHRYGCPGGASEYGVCVLFLFHHGSSCCSSKRISTTRTVLKVMTYLH